MSTDRCDVLILCGGLGSRLRPLVDDRPKGLAPVGGKPFLDILVEELLAQGFRRFIFCVGHLKEQIIARFHGRTDGIYAFSEEQTPLGTGGAVWNALHLVRCETMLVVNGDSFCRVNYQKFLEFHRAKAAVASFVVTEPGARYDGGIIRLGEDGLIRSFMEKPKIQSGQDGYINAGIYFLQTQSLPIKPVAAYFSLEHDIFPEMVAAGSCFGYPVTSKLTDIGTPERYRAANQSLE